MKFLNINSCKTRLTIFKVCMLTFALILIVCFFVFGRNFSENILGFENAYAASGDKESGEHSNAPTWLSNYDTQTDFEVDTSQKLTEFSKFVNGDYNTSGNFAGKIVRLTNDITFNETCKATDSCMNDAEEFTPIGASSCDGGNWFCGEFDGGNHIISGLFCKSATCADTLGFFAGVAGGAYIHNFRVDNSFYESVTKNVAVGLIGGVASAKAISSKTMDTSADNSASTAASNSASTTVNNSASVPTTNQVHLSNIYINCDTYFNAVNDCGGLIGKCADNCQTQINIDNCVFAGVSKSTYQDTKTDSKTGKITFISNSGGLIGNSANCLVYINNCLSMGFIMGGTNSSGILGCGDGAINITNCIDVSNLQCGSKNYGYRLYGGTTAANKNTVNSSCNVVNSIYRTTENVGELSGKATYTNVVSINSLDDVKARNIYCTELKAEEFSTSFVNSFNESQLYCDAVKKLPNATEWITTWAKTNGYFDIVIPAGVADIAPNSVYCSDLVYMDGSSIAKRDNEFIAALTYPVNIDKYFIDTFASAKNSEEISVCLATREAGSGGKFLQSSVTSVNLKNNNNTKIDGTTYVIEVNTDLIDKNKFTINYEVCAQVKIADSTIESVVHQFDTVNDTAWKLLSDLSPFSDEGYDNMVEDGYFDYKYSPYTTDQHKQLLDLCPNKPIKNGGDEYASPESVGVSSEEIIGLFDDMKERGLRTHSTMISRHGKIITEKYADGYDENTLQRMYSVSKSVVAISMCILLGDERYDVKLNDPVGKYFPEYANCNPVIYNTTIEQCMRMSTPFSHGVYKVGDLTNNNWVESFFTSDVDKDPNADEFWYDTCGTYIVDVIIERVTGKDFLTYANEQVFNKIGVSDDAWCVKAPEGYAWGGSGVMFTTKDLMRVGNLVMGDCEYKGEKLMDNKYAEMAINNLIDDAEEGYSTQDGRGYAYFTWITDFGFAYLGMGNQIYCAIPSLDISFVCTSDNQGNSMGYFDLFELITRRLVASASDGCLPENSAGCKALEKYQLKLPAEQGCSSTDVAKKVNGKTFSGGSADKISNFKLDFAQGKLTYTCHGEADKTIDFGTCENKFGNLDELSYPWRAINHPMTEDGRYDGYRTACSGAWKDDKTFVILVQVVDDYLANMTMTFKFNEDGTCASLSNKYTAEGFLTEYKMTDAQFSVE